MKLKEYLKDHLLFLLFFFFLLGILFLLQNAFKCNQSLIFATLILLSFSLIITLLFDYIRKKKFYNSLLFNIEHLEESYLVLETITEPTFYEGKLLYQAFYDINKSMLERVEKYQEGMIDFKEYIEMWIHDVKIPLSSLTLMAHNYQNQLDKSFLEQLRRLDNSVEQVLYYVRQESVEKDYMIKETSIKKVLGKVALRNKDDLLEANIDFLIEGEDALVLTDSKWLEFILNQIINNSIKYRKIKIASYIKVSIEEKEEKVIIHILDNGIGIKSSDLPRIFDKSFTGENGRIQRKSTGMGLFIVKNLCQKLGHKIKIDSIENDYTKISLIFSKNSYFDVLK